MEGGNILQPRGNHKFMRENFIFKMLSDGTQGKEAWALLQMAAGSPHGESFEGILFLSRLFC